MKEITIKDFFEQKKSDLALSLISNKISLDNKISEPFVNHPGLALAGYTDFFRYNRIQIFGETEVSYLQTLKEEELIDRVKQMFEYSIPCIITSKGLTLPYAVIYLAEELNIPLLSSRLATDMLTRQLGLYLRRIFALETNIQATLLEVFGVGVLITGKSGVGKSELALDLVERGHRLVADDWVRIIRLDDALIGTARHLHNGQKFNFDMSLRGVGKVNIETLFGSKAVRRQKHIDIQVELIQWKSSMEKEQVLSAGSSINILGSNIPITYLPIGPGKNVSVLIEIIARHYIAQSIRKTDEKQYFYRFQRDNLINQEEV